MAKAKKKKSHKKPTPGMLGSGGAAMAGRAIQNRQAQLDAQLDAQLAGYDKSIEVVGEKKKRKK
jgi:hypothetical protein